MKIVKAVEPPAGFTRAVFRLPIHLYRLRLGWLFGNRLLLLNHIGRVSGKARHDRAGGRRTRRDRRQLRQSRPGGDRPPRGTATFFTPPRSASRWERARYR